MIAVNSEHPEKDEAVIQKYNQWSESDETKELNAWRRDSPLMKEWNDQDWALFRKLYESRFN